MFEPKENVLNIQCTEDVFKHLNEVCDNEKNYTDEELTEKLHQVYDFCCGGESGGNFYFIQHRLSEHIVEQRVKKYCKKHKIKLEDYSGVLPYRKYIVEAYNVEVDNKGMYEWFKSKGKEDMFFPSFNNNNI